MDFNVRIEEIHCLIIVMKELVNLTLSLFVEVSRLIVGVILIFSSAFYLQHLDQMRKQRKLSTPDLILFVLIQVGYVLLAISLFISIFIL